MGTRTVDTSLGRAIARERSRCGFTQEAFAELCGISKRHLAAIEHGANFSVAILLEILRNLPSTAALPVDEYLLLRPPERGKG